MNSDINLIVQKEQHKYALSKAIIAISVIFGIVFFLALSVTLYNLFLKSRAATLSRNVNSVKVRMANYTVTKQKILAVSERLNSTRNIISRRKDISTRTAAVIDSIPNTFSIDSVKAENDVITVKIGSGSLALFDEFLETKLPAFLKDSVIKFKKIESSSFVRSGGYFLTLAYYF